MLELDVINIQVYDKNNKLLAPCTFKRANKLVKRKNAEWISPNQIKLLVNKEDKKKIRREIEIESNRICYICGCVIPSNMPITLDHVMPKSQGGTDEKSNIRCACKRCNDDKKDRTIQAYVKHIHNHRVNYKYISDEQLRNLRNFSDKVKRTYN